MGDINTMNDMEILGHYFYHKGLVETHRMCAVSAIEALQNQLDVAATAVGKFSLTGTIRLAGIIDQSRDNVTKHVQAANRYADLCGHPRLEA